MRKIFKYLLIATILFSGFVFLRNVDLNKILTELKSQRIYIQRDGDIAFIPDWTNEEVLAKINAARVAAGFSQLKENEKLDQSARARLSVVLSENDVDGKITGLTRDKALDNAGYQASLVGELILTGFFKSNDPIAIWNNNEITKGSMLHRDFKEVGIALKNSADRVDVYIILVAPRKIVKQATPTKTTWGGIELWDAVNKRRVEMGVNPLKQVGELCTIASIRLNQLLELGKLDGHAGFVPVLDRQDLKWISEKYNISEFLIQGYPTPTDAVKAWENTMGHKSLLAGGEYVWGCVYAQNTFGVAIAAY